MKANRFARIRDADDGASVIVGAILLFALSFLVLVMIQSNFVPVWEQDAEAAHQQTVRSQLSFLKSQMERQTEGVVTTPISSPIDLDRGGASNIFGNRNIPPGTLGLAAPGSAEFGLASPELSVSTVSDPAFVGLGESWEPITGNTIEDASKVASIRVRFAADAKSYTGESAVITITDANDAFAGKMVITLTSMSTNNDGINKASFYVRTYNADDELINAKQADELNQQIPTGAEPDYVWIYAMESVYWFDRVMAAAETPFDVEFTTTGGMPAEFSAAYFQQTAGGGDVLVGGGSETIEDYEETWPATRLVYQSLTQHFVQQDLILEYGAILVAQDGGASVSSAPAFAVGTTASRTAISWTLPQPTTTSESFASGRTNIIVTTAYGHQTLTGTAPNLTIEIATDHPGAWTTYWRNTFERAGLTEGNGFSLDSDATSASFTLDGPLSDSTHDVSIALQTARVEVLL